jgi:ubiquinone/menaquinone biosynthesis C-methylase UbiE
LRLYSGFDFSILKPHNQLMETQFIQAPSAELRVMEAGDVRRIFIKGKAVHFGKLQCNKQTLDTKLQFETLQDLVKLKGDWWLDELERREDSNYIKRRLGNLIDRFGGCKDATVLDFGSGSGSSSLVMLDMEAKKVYGVEPNAEFVKLAQARTRDEGLAGQASFIQSTDTSSLPFEDGKFDLILMNAVLEHIKPELRKNILKEIYRTLKPGGKLVVTETPNRAFPFDGHTTRLPFITWMPLILAYPFAKFFSRHVPRGQSKSDYIDQGLVGGSYWQIKKAMPDAICLNTEGGDAEWKLSFKKRGNLVKIILNLIEWKLRTFLKLPLGAFMPMLDLVFMKPRV